VKILNAGEHELIKRNVHGVLASVTALCLVYNVAAIVQRPKPPPHLYWNALLYFTVLTVEIAHIKHHQESRR
jgi:hypothetical protein